MRNQKGGKLRIALDHSSMYGSMPCIPCLCQKTYYWAKGDEKGRRWWKNSFRVRNDVGLGGARTSDPIRSPLELPPSNPSFPGDLLLGSRLGSRCGRKKTLDDEEDEERKDDVRREIWEVTHLALGTRHELLLFYICCTALYTWHYTHSTTQYTFTDSYWETLRRHLLMNFTSKLVMNVR